MPAPMMAMRMGLRGSSTLAAGRGEPWRRRVPASTAVPGPRPLKALDGRRSRATESRIVAGPGPAGCPPSCHARSVSRRPGRDRDRRHRPVGDGAAPCLVAHRDLVSRGLVDVLENQIIDAVHREWWGVVAEVERVSAGLRDLLDQASADDGEGGRPGLAEQALRPPFLAPSGAAGGRGSRGPDPLRQDPPPPPRGRGRQDRSGPPGAPGTAAGPVDAGRAGAGDTPPSADESWLEQARASPSPRWVDVTTTPDGSGHAVAFVGHTAQGLLVGMIDYDRFARLLGSIAVGRTGRSFVLGPMAGRHRLPGRAARRAGAGARGARGRRAGRGPSGGAEEYRGEDPARGRWGRLCDRRCRRSGSKAGSSR